MKSFLSLERSATFTCRKNGVERKYLVYEGDEFVNYNLIYEKDTIEENGVIAELVINGWGERNLFIDKARTKLAYYDTAVLMIDNVIQENNIYRNELFQWSTSCRNSVMHLCLKDVYYIIDWDALGIVPISMPIALRFDLKDGITPTPSRESYITNEKTKELILNRIKEVANWFVDRYNENVRSFKSFMDAYDYLGQSSFWVELEDKGFTINPLLGFAKSKLASIKVEGISHRDPIWYKKVESNLLDGYSIVGYLSGSGTLKMKSNRIGVYKNTYIIRDKGQTVIVGDNFRGNVKDFLKEKYGNRTLFIKENGLIRVLKRKGEIHSNGTFKIDTTTYNHILNLSSVSRDQWRSLINEWEFVVSSIVRTFSDERRVEDTKEFQDWLEKKRECQKELRKQLKDKGYIGLGKKQGDVTLAYNYERYGNVHFEKKSYPISELERNRFLTVLVTDDNDLELVKLVVKLLKSKVVRFARVGKKEIKKVPNHYQFINFQQFMTRDCKPFMRLASALKFSSLIEDYQKVRNYKDPVLSFALRTFSSDIAKLNDYVSINLRSPVGSDVSCKILDAADKHDLYDKQLWEEYLRAKEGIEKYDFISLLSIPSYPTNEQRARFEKLINQFLLFRKKYYNDLPEGAKIVFEPETKTETNAVV